MSKIITNDTHTVIITRYKKRPDNSGITCSFVNNVTGGDVVSVLKDVPGQFNDGILNDSSKIVVYSALVGTEAVSSDKEGKFFPLKIIKTLIGDSGSVFEMRTLTTLQIPFLILDKSIEESTELSTSSNNQENEDLQVVAQINRCEIENLQVVNDEKNFDVVHVVCDLKINTCASVTCGKEYSLGIYITDTRHDCYQGMIPKGFVFFHSKSD